MSPTCVVAPVRAQMTGRCSITILRPSETVAVGMPLFQADVVTKRCSLCEVAKPIADYYAHSTCRLGVQPWCAECHRRMWRQRYAKRRAFYCGLERQRRLARVASVSTGELALHA
jgi:hypothetical protein